MSRGLSPHGYMIHYPDSDTVAIRRAFYATYKSPDDFIKAHQKFATCSIKLWLRNPRKIKPNSGILRDVRFIEFLTILNLYSE